MRTGIHPDYHKITVVMTDGTKYDTYSTWGKEGDVLQLDVDPKTHPAWVGGINLRKTGQMEKFQNKFKDFAVAAKGTKKAASPTASSAPKVAGSVPKVENKKKEAKKKDEVAAAPEKTDEEKK